MPARITLKVIAREDIPIWGFGGKALHGLLLDALEPIDPGLASRLHADSATKPFSCAIDANFVRRKERIIISADQTFKLILNVLTDELKDRMAILIGFLSNARNNIRFSGVPIRLIPSDCLTDMIWSESNSALTSQIDSCPKSIFYFLSPTAFRRLRHQTLFPEPSLVFGSLARKWTLFGDPSFPIPDTTEYDSIDIGMFDIRTRMIEFGSFRQLGFQGNVQFDLSHCDDSLRRIVSLLTAYAPFAGVGAKTTMGMGFCGFNQRF